MIIKPSDKSQICGLIVNLKVEIYTELIKLTILNMIYTWVPILTPQGTVNGFIFQYKDSSLIRSTDLTYVISLKADH